MACEPVDLGDGGFILLVDYIQVFDLGLVVLQELIELDTFSCLW